MTSSVPGIKFQPLISHTTLHESMDLAELLRRSLIRTTDKFPPCWNKERLEMAKEHCTKIADLLASVHSTL